LDLLSGVSRIRPGPVSSLGGTPVLAMVVDGSSAPASTFVDEPHQYVRARNLTLGPFTFLKTDV
jgi:hypothetical protein